MALKVEGTLEELRDLFGSAERSVKQVQETVKKTKKTVKRAKSAWQKYMGQAKNQIKFKSGSKKGLLNMKAMSKKFKRGKK